MNWKYFLQKNFPKENVYLKPIYFSDHDVICIGGTILELTEASQKTRNVISKEIKTKTKSVLDVKIARC